MRKLRWDAIKDAFRNIVILFSISILIFICLGMTTPMQMVETKFRHVAKALIQKITKINSNNLEFAYSLDNVREDEELSRGQFISLVNQTFNLSTIGHNIFTDSNNTLAFKADQLISHKEVATILAKAFHIDTSTSSNMLFSNDELHLSLDNPITYAYAKNILNKLAGTIVNKPINLSGEFKDNILLTSTGIQLTNSLIDGNMYISEGVLNGDLTLINIDVKGNTYINGGGSRSKGVLISNSLFHTMYVNKKNEHVRLNIIDNSKIKELYISSGASIETHNNTYIDKVVIDEGAEGQIVLIEGNIDSLFLNSANTTLVLLQHAVINNLIVSSTASQSNIEVTEQAVVHQTHIYSESGFRGVGIIEEASVYVNDVNFKKKLNHLNIFNNSSVIVLGKTYEESYKRITTKNLLSSDFPNIHTYEEDVDDTIIDRGLPMVIINTAGNAVIDDKSNYLKAHFKIIDSHINPYGIGLYEGIIDIKGRGNSSWNLPKKPYAIITSEKVALLDMPEEDEWVLIANHSDKSLLRNYLAYYLGQSLNFEYTPKMRFVDVYMNGEYQGNYLLGEKIKVSQSRLNINQLKQSDVHEDNITGGYIIEKDILIRMEEGDTYFKTNVISGSYVFNIQSPKTVKTTPEQLNYIVNYFNEAEYALYGPNFKDKTLGYENYFDVDSFIDWYIVNELYKNVDANFLTSVYMYKDKDEKLKFGPIWDFDLGAGNAFYNGADTSVGFYVKNGKWISRFFDDPAIVQKLQKRWEEIKDNQVANMMDMIDAQKKYIEMSADYNFKKWNILGNYVWPNTSGYETRTTFESEVEYLKEWLEARIAWFSTAIYEL